ncbi:MAG: sensor domain-containing diguanylate cyclase [Mycobacteriales bacterium]
MDADRLAETLVEFAHTLLADSSIQGVLDQLTSRIVDVVPVDGAGVRLLGSDFEPQQSSASDETCLRLEVLQTEVAEGPCITAHVTGEIVLLPDLATDVQFPRFSPSAFAHGVSAVFAFPLVVEGEALGALGVYRNEPGDMAAADLAAVKVLADVAASYVRNSRLHLLEREAADEARYRSLHDGLTGLPNRELLHDRLLQVAAKAQRTGSVAAVFFVDLDKFKTINDKHGHAGGDQVLLAVAERLRHAIRPGDTLARLAGDEFVIVCDGLERPEQAEVVALRIAEALAVPIPLGEVPLDVRASVGIAFAGKGADLPEVLLSNADAAMFEAKQRGGAHYVVHDHDVGSML